MAIKSKTQLKLEINANDDFTREQQDILSDTVDSYANAFPMVTTTQRNALTPTDGLTVYNTDTDRHEYWNGTAWAVIGGNTATVNMKHIVITPAQLADLANTPVTLFEAPGAGYAVAPVNMFMRLNYISEAYDFAEDSVFVVCNSQKETEGSRITIIPSVELNGTATALFGADYDAPSGNPMVENDSIVLYASGDGPTQGNGSLSLYILYCIIPF